MKSERFTSVIVVLLLALCLSTLKGFSQKWSGVNGNEWLAGKYGQQWVRIGVSVKGIHKVTISSLPAAFQSADKAKLQIWHRGVQIKILKADDTEILFYGVTNDGASDQLLYRYPNSRVNPYFTTYSIESAYFLTIGAENGLRAENENTSVDTNVAALLFHNQVELKTYQTEYTHFAHYPTLPNMNSFFEDGKTGTGTRLPTVDQATSPVYTANPASAARSGSVATNFNFAAKNVYAGSVPKIKLLLSGRGGNAQVQIKVGKTGSTLRQVTVANTSEFHPLEISFDLDPAQDYNASGGTLGFQDVIPSSWFSVSYFTVSYNQTIDAQSQNSYEFNFSSASAGSKSRIPIINPPANAAFYDVSNADNPRIIQGSAANLMVTRNGGALKLLAWNSAQNISVAATKISSITFQDVNPASYNYLIVTADDLISSAQAFAAYRQNDSPGKKYLPLVIKIKDLYNTFNYGEPSPVAIRRFVDYMISDDNKSKYLLLIGKSISSPAMIVSELPDEVPTMGFPGSDLLLVDGLRGTPDDVPAIPVGRISGVSDAEVNAYLQKIKKYEGQTDLEWRKNVMHISGGKTGWEVEQFSGYLSLISNNVVDSSFNGSVIPKIKTQAADVIEQLNISAELNGAGLGLISYFGHAATYRTDYNAGYVSDPAKGYGNTERYPVMFYNGCGVNNIFSNRFATSVNTSSSRPLSLDWLIASGKGAIAVFGNTFDSYAITSGEYLNRLYPAIFLKSDYDRGTIGQILQEVALQTKIAEGYDYNPGPDSLVTTYYNSKRANIHQVLLQGDPALKILLSVPLANTVISSCVSLGDQCSGNSQEIRSYTLNLSSGATLPFKLTYKAHEGPSTGRIRINGGAWQTFSLSQTNVGEYVEAVIGVYALNSGTNTIEFASGSGYICFRELCVGAPQSNCVSLQDLCSGNSSEIRSYAMNMPSSGSLAFKLTYKAHEGPSTGRIRINGGTWQTFSLAQTAIGEYVETIIGSYSLNSGNNTIEFASGSGYVCFRQLCVVNNSARLGSGESNEEEIMDEITTSPNPNDGDFDVKFYLEPGKTALLTLTSQTGVKLMSKYLVGHGAHVERVQLNHPVSGVAIVQIRTNKKILTRKIFIVK